MKHLWSYKRYMAVALGTSVVFLYVMVWLGNLIGLRTFFALPVSLGEKLRFLFASILSLGTNFTVFSLVSILILALLFGINIALLTYYIRHRRTGKTHVQLGKGLGGFIAGIFGIGCSACGAALVGPLFAAVGAGGLLAALPFHGQEFLIVGILLLIYSIWSLARHVRTPDVCDIDE